MHLQAGRMLLLSCTATQTAAAKSCRRRLQTMETPLWEISHSPSPGKPSHSLPSSPHGVAFHLEEREEMVAWRSPPCGRRLLLMVLFLGVIVAEVPHGSGAEATTPPPRLFPTEVRVLRRIAGKLGVSHWDFSGGMCGSGGLECDCSFSNNTLYIVTLLRFLKEQNFSGQLQPDFAELPNLLQLDLSRSLFHGGVPDQWAQMKLQGLSLMGNRLSGPFPMALTKITTLTNLSIEGNGFHGPIPPEIGHLTQMEKLILSTNEFTGPLPVALSLLTKLTDLRISGNNLSGRLPDFWGKLKRLKKLQIEGSLLEGPIPSSLSKLTDLYDLRISDLRGSGSFFPDLSGMQSMKTMVLRNCSMSGSIPSLHWDIDKS